MNSIIILQKGLGHMDSIANIQSRGFRRRIAGRTGLVRVLATVLLAGGVLAAGVGNAQTAADPCENGPTLYRAAKFTEARAAFLACLDQGGAGVDILLPLVVMAVREERQGEGIEFGLQAVESAPEDAEARYWYGRALLGAERVDEARGQWEKGLQLSVNHKGILEGMARLAMAENEPAKAYQLLAQLQRQGVNDPWLNRLMADIAAGKGLWQQSLGHLEMAMAQEEPGLQDYMTASELSILVGDHQGAVDFCRRAVALEPGAVSFGGLGEAYFAVEEIDSALVYLQLAVEQAPQDPRYRFNLANALEVAGLYEEADGHFIAFLDMVPDDSVGHFNYGVHLDRLGRSEEALAEVTRAVDLNPDMLTARVVRAQILEDMGRWDEALEVVRGLNAVDEVNTVELNAWEERILRQRDFSRTAVSEGKIHLLHMVLGSAEVLEIVTAELAAGTAFTTLAVQYSSGGAAAKGGDIGWIVPTDMVESMQTVILPLGINETSPPVEAGGLYHIFKRVP
ncbi:MAG: tetratricopeptide repeat protein [Candidatus Krumholzibacteriota bacterium]